MSLRRAGDGITAALVTGACSGIGLAIATRLASLGYDLVLVSPRGPELEAAREHLARTHGVTVHAVVSDLARREAARELFARVNELGVDVKILVNNAGFFFFGEVADVEPERAEAMLLLHVVTPSLLCSLFGREMRRARRGYVLNVASISAWGDMPGIAYYASSKKYLRGFTRALRTELTNYGIGVTCVLPGATATGLYDPKVVDVRMAQRIGVMLPPERVANDALAALFRGDEECIPGALSRAFAWVFDKTPRAVVRLVRTHGPWMRARD